MERGASGSSRDPVGAESAWWCEVDKAGAILAVALACRNGIPAAAARLGLAATPHEGVIERAGAAISRIENGVGKANTSGTLQFFNQQFRKRWFEAAAQGRGFMSYRSAQVRLRRALADAVASKVTTGPNRQAPPTSALPHRCSSTPQARR
jgi:hypothetical protein